MSPLQTAAIAVSDLARLAVDAAADGVVWVAVEAAELARRNGWFADWLE